MTIGRPCPVAVRAAVKKKPLSAKSTAHCKQASKHCYRRRLARLQPGARTRTHVARRRRSLGHLAIFGACLAFPPWRSQGRSEHRMDGQSGGGAQMTSAPIEGTAAAGVAKF